MPRFVLLRHECPSGVPRPSHWDLMLEAEGALRTWVLESLPHQWQKASTPSSSSTASNLSSGSQGAAVEITAEEIQPHRLAYLTKQGPLSAGRGHIIRLEHGAFRLLESAPCHLRAELHGQSICGQLDLKRADAVSSCWQLTFASEDPATE